MTIEGEDEIGAGSQFIEILVPNQGRLRPCPSQISRGTSIRADAAAGHVSECSVCVPAMHHMSSFA